MIKELNIKFDIKIEGSVSVDDEFSLNELNCYLQKRTNPSLIQLLSDFLDLEKDMITIESKYW